MSNNESSNTPKRLATDPPEGAPRLLTPKQAAEALAISPRKLWGMTASGEISSVRLGRAVRYSVEDLQRFVASRSREGSR